MNCKTYNTFKKHPHVDADNASDQLSPLWNNWKYSTGGWYLLHHVYLIHKFVHLIYGKFLVD